VVQNKVARFIVPRSITAEELHKWILDFIVSDKTERTHN